VQFDAEGFRIEGDFTTAGQHDRISCTMRIGGKKDFRLNDIPYSRYSSHIGRYPVVMVAPDDGAIITGTSSERRKFVDILLAQTDPLYLEQLIVYKRILMQRNSHLKDSGMGKRPDDQLLDILDGQLAEAGEFIYLKRKGLMDHFANRVQQGYDYIAGNHETTNIYYRSTLINQAFITQLTQSRSRDILLQRTTTGIHRDDLEFLLNGSPLRTSGSQGQRKSFLFALKLAEYEVILEKKEISPLLLLDDVFEKLDHQRISRLISLICANGFGQVFITDTDRNRLENALHLFPELLQVIDL